MHRLMGGGKGKNDNFAPAFKELTNDYAKMNFLWKGKGLHCVGLFLKHQNSVKSV